MFENVHLLTLSLAGVAGSVLGAAYFGGLWWTIKRMQQAKHPINLYIVSLICRLALLLSAFYCLLKCLDWLHLAVALAGCLAARLALIRCIGEPDGRSAVT